jgi:hypothetical protein
MHLNTDEVQDMISNLCDNPASYLYQYLRRYKLFTDHLLPAGIYGFFCGKQKSWNFDPANVK